MYLFPAYKSTSSYSRLIYPHMITRSQASQVQCSICLTICQDALGRIQCHHAYCFNCIKQWATMRQDCPVCRHRISQIQKLRVGNLKDCTNKLKEIEPETISVEEEQFWSDLQLSEVQSSQMGQVAQIVSRLAQTIVNRNSAGFGEGILRSINQFSSYASLEQ